MNNIASDPIFSVDELRYNEDLKAELFELVSRGEAILFVGSGLSIPVGYPSWDSLLSELEDLAQQVNPEFTPDPTTRQASPLEYAGLLKECFSKANEISTYFSKLTEIFSRKNPCFKDHHKKIVQLPFSLIMTTNYDPVLSEALLKSIEENSEPLRTDLCFAMNEETIPQLSTFLLSLHKGLGTPKRVAHLHGYHDRPKEIILTKQDYEKYYFNKDPKQPENQSPTIHFLVLWALIATRRIVFFGFGMKDPYLLQMLEDVRKRLWRWDKPTHINIASIDAQNSAEIKSQAKFLKEKYGVNTYFYENQDSTHQQLEALINELHAVCCAPDDLNVADSLQHEPSDKSSNSSAKDIATIVNQATGSANGTIPAWILSTNKKLDIGIKDEDK